VNKIASLTLLLTLALAGQAIAREPAGKIVHCQGTVMIFHDGSVPGQRAVNGADLFIGDQAKSLTDSQAKVELVDGNRILLAEKSTLTIEGFDSYGVEGGRVLFDIQKRGDLQGLRVKTATALIGVKGTRFAVDSANDAVAIHLERGRLQVDAVGELFRRHKQNLKDEYEETLDQMKQAYEKNVDQLKTQFEEGSKQLAEGDFESFQSFDMEAGQSFIVAADHEVKPIEMPEDLQELFKQLDEF